MPIGTLVAQSSLTSYSQLNHSKITHNNRQKLACRRISMLRVTEPILLAFITGSEFSPPGGYTRELGCKTEGSGGKVVGPSGLCSDLFKYPKFHWDV
jgi:hypothetical protein